MTKEERIKDITRIGDHLGDALTILNKHHNQKEYTRELAILRTDLQKLLAFYMFYILSEELLNSKATNEE